jgi:IrrE N-terminal-like domain
MTDSSSGGEVATVADASGDASTNIQAPSFYAYEAYGQPTDDWRLFSAKYPTGIDSRQIEVLGETISRELGYEPGSDIRLLVGKLGGSLMIAPLRAPDTSDATLLVKDHEPGFKIIVPATSSSRRDQLTVAKALGNYFLHHRFFQLVAPSRARASKAAAEQEALAFALAFLMPTEDFKRTVAATKGRNDLVAAAFGVPVEAADRRKRSISSD